MKFTVTQYGEKKDIYEVITIPAEKTIKLNGCRIPGYTIINPQKKIIIDDKEIELSEESYQNLKKSLIVSKPTHELVGNLVQLLVKNGYQENDAEKMSQAYYNKGLNASIDTSRWANDDKQDCSRELREYLLYFETSN